MAPKLIDVSSEQYQYCNFHHSRHNHSLFHGGDFDPWSELPLILASTLRSHGVSTCYSRPDSICVSSDGQDSPKR